MDRMTAEPIFYEIESFLGEGLTSEVYKAFRVDRQGYTKQVVALKIVKSKNHVQTFRKEFEKLLQVESQHCVKVYAWESLKQGPALVLEYLNGVTLEQLSNMERLKEETINEIIAQVQKGLMAIHKSELVHGDLNLKNIFISPEGVVKLIDFGVVHGTSVQMGTPHFMAPEGWMGTTYTKESDYFSLGLIKSYLESPSSIQSVSAHNWKEYIKPLKNKNSLLMEAIDDRKKLSLKSCRKQKENLAHLIQKCIDIKNQSIETRVIKNDTEDTIKVKKPRFFIPLLSLLFCFCFPVITMTQEPSSLEVRNQKWLDVQINGLPSQFTPFKRGGLRPGRYHIQWGPSSRGGEKFIELKAGETFILKPGSIKL